MSSKDLPHHSELGDAMYSPSSKAYNEQKEGEQQGNKEGTQPEQPENPKETQDRCDAVDGPRTSQQPQTSSTDIDLPSLQAYISHLPDALVPEFALLLAQRMK